MSKISLIVLGLVLLVCLTAAAREEEEVSSLRVVREAAPDAKQRKRTQKRGKSASKKLKKRRGNKRRKIGRSNKGRQSGRAVSDSCFEQSITIMKMWKDVISNFEKQRKRMKKQNETAGKKSGKKGAFGGIAQRLLEAGGGNKSAPSCGGSTDNDGAAQLANLTKTLDECEDNVHAACDPSNIPQPNMTFIDMCDDLVAKFKAGAKECLDKSVGGSKTDTATACSCWTNTTLLGISQEAKMCKASNESKAIAEALKTCTAAFGKCRKYEDDASTAITACSSDSSKLTAKAVTLSANGEAVKSAQEKVKTLTNTTRRLARAASTCAEVVMYAEKLAKMAKNAPASPDIATVAKEITDAGSVTCSEAEKTSLTSVQADLEKAAGKIATALEAVQEQLLTLTGSTVSSGALVSAAPTSTKAARRIRNFNVV